jgi:YidC/Oxa1 family membrane protein insertase
MERRTLIAAALSFAVIMLWTAFFGPKPKPEEELVDGGDGTSPPVEQPFATMGEAAPQSTQPPASLGVPDTNQPASGLAFGAADAPEQTVVVSTEQYTATFSSRGGALVAFTTNEHLDDEGMALHLLREDVTIDSAQPEVLVDVDGAGPLAALSLRDTNFNVTSRPANGLSVGEVVFTATAENGASITRRYTCSEETYGIDHVLTVNGLPEGYDGFATLMWGAGVPHTEEKMGGGMAGQSFSSLARIGNNFESKQSKDFSTRDASYDFEGGVQWAISKSRYFFAGLFSQDEASTAVRFFGREQDDLLGFAVEVPTRGGVANARHTLYVGPATQEELKRLGNGIENQVGISDMYGMPGFIEAFFSPLARILHRVLNFFYAVIPNYGVAILLLAFVTKALFFPLTRKSSQSMKAMSDLKPEMEALREKYKDDAQKLNVEMMGLYKKHGVNPMAGCLPLLIQMPVFIALFAVLRSAIELRHAPFALWINDLSAPDTLFSMGGIPLLPDQLHVLPLLMAATTMLMQQQTITDPRQKTMMLAMPVVMLFFFYSMPSGLVLYWTAQNLFSWVEQKIAKKAPTTAAVKAA